MTSRVTGSDCTIVADDFDYGSTATCNSTVSSESFTYDEVGNRSDRSAVIGTGNQITSFDGFSISYDADGNITQKYKEGVENRTYFWNAENRLDSLRINDWHRFHFDYDAFGRVVRRSSGDPYTFGVEEHYLWDGDNLAVILNSSFNGSASTCTSRARSTSRSPWSRA